MIEAKKIWLLWIVATLSIATFLFWEVLDKNINPFLSENYGFTVSFYYVPLSIVFFLLFLFIFVNFKQYLISFILLGLGINNLADELFFNPTKLQLNELVFFILIVSFGLYRQKLIRGDSKRNSKTISNGNASHNNRSFETDN